MPTSLNATTLLHALTAAGEDPVLSLEDAITTAFEWHPGGGSALYAFASNKGKLAPDMFPRLSQEIQDAKNWVQTNAKPLDSGSYPEYADDASRASKVGLSTSQWLLRRLDNVVEQAKNATHTHAETITSSSKEAGFGEDSIRALVYFARSNKQRLTDILRDQGATAVVEELKALPGMENAGSRVAPAFVQWLQGQLHDSGLVETLERVFTKRAALVDDEALHMVSGALVIAGLRPSEVQAQGSKVRVAGLKVNPHVLKNLARIAAEYDVQIKLDSDFNKPGPQPETYPEPVRHEPEGINRTAGSPSAAGNHSGAGNPVNPTGDAPDPLPTDEEEEQEQPVPPVPVKPHTSYGQGDAGEVYGQRKAAMADPLNGEGETLIKVYHTNDPAPSQEHAKDRTSALVQVHAYMEDPSVREIQVFILWGDQWSLTNRWMRTGDEWDEQTSASIYRTAADEEEFEFEDAQCPECDGPAEPLGALGNLMHYRCRDCGAQFSHKASRHAADDSLTGTLAEIETMLSSVQELADKAVAKARLQSNPDLSANVERMNVKIYESLVSARTAKVAAQGSATPETPAKEENLAPVTASTKQAIGPWGGQGYFVRQNQDAHPVFTPPTQTPSFPAEHVKTGEPLTVEMPREEFDALGDDEIVPVSDVKGTYAERKRRLRATDVKNPGAELSYDEKEQLLKDMKGPEAPAPEDKDPRYGYKLPLTSSLVLAAEQLTKGPDASQGDTMDNAIEFINANGAAMDDFTVQQLREALTAAGYTQPVADSAITELLGQDALLALATPVKALLGE